MSIPNQDTKQYSNPNNTSGSEPTNPTPVTIHDGTIHTTEPTTGGTETTTTGNGGTGGTLTRTALLGIALITGIFILANLTTWAISLNLNNLNLPIANYHILSLTYSAAILTLTIAAAYPITRKLGTTIPKLLLGIAVAVELCCNNLIFFVVLDGSDAGECWFQRCPAFTVQAYAVHHHIVEASELLSERALLLWLACVFQDKLLNALLVLLEEVYKGTVAGVFSVQWVALQPTSGCILVEVGAGFHVQVHVFLIDT